jgi:hypothetical protein
MGTAAMSRILLILLHWSSAPSWRSTRTPLVTLSAAESEIIALSAATQEAVYLRKLAISGSFRKCFFLESDRRESLQICAGFHSKSRS